MTDYYGDTTETLSDLIHTVYRELHDIWLTVVEGELFEGELSELLSALIHTGRRHHPIDLGHHGLFLTVEAAFAMFRPR